MSSPTANQKICCIGAGYVGGPTCAVIANKNPRWDVTVVDLDAERIRAWNSDHLPIHEPGLFELVKSSRDRFSGEGLTNLYFSTDVCGAIDAAGIILISVNTPTKSRGRGAGSASDLGAVESAVRTIASVATSDKIIVEKSTVPCRTAEIIREILAANGRPGVRFDVLSNPEFLAEGTAIRNLLEPDRILIGSLKTPRGLAAAETLASIYTAWIPRSRIITMNIWSSELAKLAANALLAQRISSINALSAICERTAADIDELSFACGLDSRIGPKMLKASMGWGGSCFKKDVLSLSYMAEMLHLPEVAAYFSAVVDINEFQKDRFTNRVISCLNNTLVNKRVAVLGFAYKKDTGDTRESAAISLVDSLVAEGATVCIYDPEVKEDRVWSELQACKSPFENMQKYVRICENAYQACDGAYAAVIVTEWDEFSNKPPHSQNGFQFPALDRTRELSPPSSVHSLDERQPMTTKVPQQPSRPSTTALSRHSRPETPLQQSRNSRIDWSIVATKMQRPMFLFDGRNILDADALVEMGFRVEGIGKPRREN